MAAETTAISKLVDGVLLVIECGRTPINLVLEMIEILGKEKVLSIIFNKYDMQFSNYYGYKKYSRSGNYYECYY
jgi:Mrp family chromosome partitioning ATPase